MVRNKRTVFVSSDPHAESDGVDISKKSREIRMVVRKEDVVFVTVEHRVSWKLRSQGIEGFLYRIEIPSN